MTPSQHTALRALCLLSVDSQWASAVEVHEVEGSRDQRSAGNALAAMARAAPPLVEVRRANGSSRGPRVVSYRPTPIGRPSTPRWSGWSRDGTPSAAAG
jgi:hypothetical protein